MYLSLEAPKQQHLRLCLLLILFLALAANSAHANTRLNTDNLQLVGKATLSKLFWTIYDSRLVSHTGEYKGIEAGLTLELTYQRKISAEQLIDSTREQWQALSLYESEQSEQWLAALKKMWPDVNKSDVLTLQVDENMQSHFFFNNQLIGVMSDSLFTQHFLSIWLSPNSRYSTLQQQLIGLTDSM